ncbi:MAG: T9SS type A sorting domain-containing protein [Crocinitomicaceae bacterium]
MKKHLLILLVGLSSMAFSQDSLRVMYHNILNFPSAGSNRIDTLRTILTYAKPDVYVVCELETEAGGDMILNEALNVNGQTNYQRVAFVDGGTFTNNLLFYNADKLGFISQEEIGTVLRDINTYVLYYKAPNLTAQSDTIYLNFFACHLKAGSSDYQQRNTEIQQAKFYMNSIANQIENVFIGGDMNVYSGFESAILTMKNTGSVPLFDPIDVAANWSGDWNYADIHTQSTRTGGLQGGAGGGMDDRFDLIFVSEDVLDSDNGVKYINNSYQALGQDGNHFNDNINDGFNSAAPDSVINALYYASDHLPVIMDVVLDETANIKKEKVDFPGVYYNVLEHAINFSKLGGEPYKLKLFDLSGQLVLEYEGSSGSINLPAIPAGIYLVKMRYKGEFTTSKLSVF